MKKIITILILLGILVTYSFSQQQLPTSAHTDLIRQAWQYLKLHRPNINWNITQMASHIEPGTTNDCGDDNDPWKYGSVVVGACKEDVDDPVYLQSWTSATVTHFFKADTEEGDDWEFYPPPYDHYYKNSYKKARAYMYSNSEHKIFFAKLSYDPGIGQSILGRYYLYDNLFDFYNTGHCYYWGYKDIAGYDHQLYDPPEEIHMDLYSAQKYSWIILGRIAHLLADNCTPVHVHGIPHPLGESYEGFMDANYSDWDYTLHIHNPYLTNFNLGPEEIISLYDKQNPLRFLFYVSNQIADRFPAMGDLGNSTYTSTNGGDNYATYIEPIYNSMTNFDPYSDYNKGDYCYNFAIKATASLFYWFATNTNQVQYMPDPPHNLSVTTDLIGDPTLGYQLYWNQSKNLIGYCEGTNLHYRWHYNVCSSSPEEQWPISVTGLSSSINNNVLNLVNNYYAFQSCSTNNIPSGLYFMIQLEVYDNYNQKAFSNYIKVTPQNTIYKAGGCPWIAVQTSDTNFILDNNILHKSQFPENAGQDISDKYLFNIKPGIIDDYINLSILETNTDTTSINMVKLYAVDHPIGTRIGITENNEIVMFENQKVQSTTDAAVYDTSSNYQDITRQIQYYINNHPRDTVKIDTLAEAVACFDAKPRMNPVLGILAEFMFSQSDNIQPVPITPPAKDKFAGYIAATTVDPKDSTVGEYDIDFSGRENGSLAIIPVSLDVLNTISNVSLSAYRPLNLKYLSLVELNYSGFTITELPLDEAVNSITGDITNALYEVDDSVSIVTPSAFVNLSFENVPLMNNELTRDYVVEINGSVFVQPVNASVKQNFKNVSNVSKTLKTKLNANYPNPFNPITKISYSIEKSGIVSIKVFDILGREVKTLVNEFMVPGEYNIEFNGSELSSGIYFYRLETNNYIESKKMLLIK